MIKITSSIFSDHNVVWQSTTRKQTTEDTNIWRLNDMPVDNLEETDNS